MGDLTFLRGETLSPAAGDRRARRQFDALVAEARAELVAVEAGDLEKVWFAHRALNNAVGLLLVGRWGRGMTIDEIVAGFFDRESGNPDIAGFFAGAAADPAPEPYRPSTIKRGRRTATGSIKKASDTRSKKFVGRAVEIESVPVEILRRWCREVIEQHVDQHELDVLRVAEESERSILWQLSGSVGV